MVAIAARGLTEQVTWWPVVADGYGGDTLSSPVVISGRWEDRQEVYIGQIDRREHVSKAIVFLDRGVGVGDYLALGNYANTVDPTSLTGAEKIQRYQKFPDLRNLEALHKVIL